MQRRAETDLSAALGDMSLCVLAKSGGSLPAVKYHEGRAAVLSVVVRTLTRAPASLAGAVVEERRRLMRMSRLAETDAQWQGYVQGGLDTLDAVESLLDEPTSST